MANFFSGSTMTVITTGVIIRLLLNFIIVMVVISQIAIIFRDFDQLSVATN